MPGDTLPVFAAGQPLSADDLNALVEFLRSHTLSSQSGSGLTVTQTGGGTYVSAARTPGFWAKLTSEVGGGGYVFTRLAARPAGTWVADGSLTGTAWEVNGVGGISIGVIVWIEITSGAADSFYRFTLGLCP